MKIWKQLKECGIRNAFIKIEEKTKDKFEKEYRRSYLELSTTTKEMDGPFISIVIPAFNPKKEYFRDLLFSINNQNYENWELCLADASTCEDTKIIFQEFSNKDSRFKYTRVNNYGISENTNRAIEMARGEYILFADHDDVLARNALFEIAKCIKDRPVTPKLIYSDEDKISEDGKTLFRPHIKTDYNIELLNHYNYMCHVVAVEKECLEAVGGLRKEYDGAQDYDFLLRVSENVGDDEVVHIPKVLYHWRAGIGSTAATSGNKGYSINASLKALSEHYRRIGRSNIEISQKRGTNYYDIDLNKNLSPLEILQEYMWSTDGSVGIVAPKINYKNKVFSCGLSYSTDGNPQYMFQDNKKYWEGYFYRWRVASDVSAVLLEGAVVSPKVRTIVGEPDNLLAPGYRDLDYCFRIKKAGFRILVVPEVAIRITSKEKRKYIFCEESRKMLYERWGEYIKKGDPYYFDYKSFCCNGDI